MTNIEERTMIPIQRFRNILGSLELPEHSVEELYWLRFAAQAAILRPEKPEDIASLIRKTASLLHENTPWYESLSTAARFAVAALLVQNHDSPCDFIKGHRHISNLFRQQELRPGGMHETLSVVIMRMNADKRRIHHQDITRFKAIYEEMKHFHWWLTGPDDFPAVAALSHLDGSSKDVITQTERMYQYLVDSGFKSGDNLQSAANLLPLLEMDPGAAATRFIGLRELVKTESDNTVPYHYDSLLPLVMLKQDVEHVIQMTLAIYKELEMSSENQFGASTFGIAADLCFLDLIRYDKDLNSRDDFDAVKGMLSDIHRFHIITAATLSRFDPTAEGLFVKDTYEGWYI